MNPALLNLKIVDIHFEDSPLVEIRPALRSIPDEPNRRAGFWARQWRKVCIRS